MGYRYNYRSQDIVILTACDTDVKHGSNLKRYFIHISRKDSPYEVADLNYLNLIFNCSTFVKAFIASSISIGISETDLSK